jgi:transcription antitermination factor NusG
MALMPLDATMPECVATQPAAADPAGIRVQQPRWAVLATYPKAEAWAEQNLRQRGYTPFLPRYLAKVRDRSLPTITRFVQRPLFAGYIFCQHNPPDPWRPIRYCPGIRANLIGGKEVQYARAGAVEAVQAAQAFAATQPPREAQWHLGDAVAPRVGPFAGLQGVVLATNGENATVGILFLGQLREVVYPFDALTPRDDF